MKNSQFLSTHMERINPHFPRLNRSTIVGNAVLEIARILSDSQIKILLAQVSCRFFSCENSLMIIMIV